MLKLSSSISSRGPQPATGPATGPSPLPGTGHTTLAVSWLNGQFAALAVQRGQVTGRWVCLEVNGALAELPKYLKEAVQRTGYRGTTMQLVLAHPRLSQLWLEVPETGGAAVQRFLQRQAQQAKSFEGKAAFSFQPTIAAKQNRGLLLHLVPQEFIEQLAQGAESAGLILTSVLPIAALAQQQLAQMALPETELAVLAVEVGAQTILVVGRGNGEICLARTLNEGWARNPERFAEEVNRTINFVNQQFALNATSVWLNAASVLLFGAIAPQRLTQLQKEFTVPVRVSPVPLAEDWWAELSLQCPAGHPANFVGRERQAEPTRRRLLSVTLVVVGLLVLASVGLTVGFHLLRQREQHNAVDLQHTVAQLSQRFQELTVSGTQLTHYQTFIREAADGRPPPVPAWFLAHLSEVVGADMVVTNLRVRAAGDRWQVEVAGRLPAIRRTADADALSNSIGAFKMRLERGPFHVHFATNAAPSPSPMGTLDALSRSWDRRDASRASRSPVTGDFHLEGHFP